MHFSSQLNNNMGIFDIINGVTSSVSGLIGGGANQLVPPLEVDSGDSLVSDGFKWLKDQGEWGELAGTILGGAYSSIAVRSLISGVPPGGARPVNNINTQISSSGDKMDWRLRLIIPSDSRISYASGPLAALKSTCGVLFPYTPQVEMTYTAEYDEMHPTHSNYATPAYNKSKVDNINVSAEFSANDASEAAYAMGVIHFFRTVTKMYFGNDGADNGRPPPILILKGYGTYMFNGIPVVCKSASITLPKEVDYVAAGKSTEGEKVPEITGISILDKRINNVLPKILGGQVGSGSMKDVSYVPSSFQINCILQPIYSRTEIAERFSLKDFATGSLTRSGGFI